MSLYGMRGKMATGTRDENRMGNSRNYQTKKGLFKMVNIGIWRLMERTGAILVQNDGVHWPDRPAVHLLF